MIRTLPPMQPMQTTGLALLFGGMALAPFGFAGFLGATGEMLTAATAMADLAPFGAILFLGIVLAGFGQTLRVYAIAKCGPVFFSITGYLIPVWATILGAIILDEDLAPVKILAFAIITAGLLLAQTPKSAVSRMRRRLKARMRKSRRRRG